MTKKLIVMLLLLSLSTLVAMAQEPRERTISGNVMDAELKEPMVQATVQLFWAKDSSFVGGTVTDLRGNFALEAPSNGIFRVKISSIGFQAIQREVSVRRNQSVDMGQLMMATDAVLLKEAVVTGRAAQVVVKKDTLAPRARPSRSSSSAFLVPRWTKTVISPSMARR